MGGPNIQWLPEFHKRYPEAAAEYAALIEFNWECSLGFEAEGDEIAADNENLRARILFLEEAAKHAVGQRNYYKGVLADHFDKASSYFNLMVSAGFAGLFSTWALSASTLTTNQSAFIGGMAMLSLSVFIGWELAKMVSGAIEARQMERLGRTPGNQFEEADRMFHLKQDKSEARFHRAWLFAVVLSAGPAAVAGLYLMILLWLRLVPY